MSESKWAARDRKIARRSQSMRVSGRSVFVIASAQQKRDERTQEASK